MSEVLRECAAEGCNFTSARCGGPTVFRFPKDVKRQQLWLKGAGCAKLLRIHPKTLHNARYLCPAHFEPSEFWDKYKQRLQRNAVPTKFSCKPLPDSDVQAYPDFDIINNNTSNVAMEVDSDIIDEPESVENLRNSSTPPGNFIDFNHDPTKLGKRPREEDEDIIDLFIPDLKKRREERVEAACSRRSSECTGARYRTRRKSVAIERLTKNRILEASGVSRHGVSSDVRKVVRTAQEYRNMARKIRYKLRACQQQNKSLSKLTSRKFVDMVDEMSVSPRLRAILKGELRNFKRQPCGRTWTLDDKMFALAIFKRSPRAYRFLREHITLPCERTLKSILEKIPIQPGLSKPLLSLLKKSVAKLSKLDKNCVLLFDEIYLLSHLQFSKKHGNIVGYEDYGEHGRTHLPADHALVFMVQGLRKKWTQPVAYYFVHKTCPSSMLKVLICDVLKSLFDIGLNVLATVSDQGPTNRGAVSELKQSSPLHDDIIYSVHGHILVHIYDIPHILKNVRNNFLSSDLEYAPGKIAKFRHIIEYFKLDQSLCSMSSLTLKHLNPLGRLKMKVNLAAQTLSASVANGIETCFELSGGKYLSDCMITALLLRDVDLFFYLTHGPRSPGFGNEKQKETRKNVTASSLHHEQWPLMVEKLKKWSYIRKSTGTRHVPPCIKGWIESVKGMQWLWLQLKKTGATVMYLRNLNQDALENFFCCVRQCVGSGSDLNCCAFTSAVKTCIIAKFGGSSKDKNCLDDGAFVLNDLRELFVDEGDADGDSLNKSVSASLQRGARPTNDVIKEGLRTLKRQVPTFVYAILLNDLLKTNCECCVRSLSTTARSVDVKLLLSKPYSFVKNNVHCYPSAEFVNLFLKCQQIFLYSWETFCASPKNFQTVVQCFNLSDSDWSWLDCDEHASTIKKELQERIAVILTEKRCSRANLGMKTGCFKRTRQVLNGSSKDADGLLPEDRECELDPEDLTFLEDRSYSRHKMQGASLKYQVYVLVGTGFLARAGIIFAEVMSVLSWIYVLTFSVNWLLVVLFLSVVIGVNVFSDDDK